MELLPSHIHSLISLLRWGSEIGREEPRDICRFPSFADAMTPGRHVWKNRDTSVIGRGETEHWDIHRDAKTPRSSFLFYVVNLTLSSFCLT